MRGGKMSIMYGIETRDCPFGGKCLSLFSFPLNGVFHPSSQASGYKLNKQGDNIQP